MNDLINAMEQDLWLVRLKNPDKYVVQAIGIKIKDKEEFTYFFYTPLDETLKQMEVKNEH